MALGKQIQKYRVRAGLTLDDLQGLSGVERGTISALENRDSSRSKFGTRLARAFGLTVEQIEDEATDHDIPPSSPAGRLKLGSPQQVEINVVSSPVSVEAKAEPKAKLTRHVGVDEAVYALSVTLENLPASLTHDVIDALRSLVIAPDSARVRAELTRLLSSSKIKPALSRNADVAGLLERSPVPDDTLTARMPGIRAPGRNEAKP